MTNKKIIAIVAVIIILFLGIFTFANPGKENNNDKNNGDNQNIIDENQDEEKEKEEEQETTRPKRISADKAAPIIKLIGDAEVYIDLGNQYEELGAEVTDNRDSDLVATISGSVDTTKAGLYTLTYTAADEAGNEATPIIRTVKVRPIITGKSEYVHEIGNKIPSLTMDVTTVEGEAPTSITSDSVIPWNTIGGPYDMVFKFSTSDGVEAEEKIIKITVQDIKEPWVFFTKNGNNKWERNSKTFVIVRDKGILDLESLKYLWLPSDSEKPTEGEFIESFTNYGRIKTPIDVTGRYRLWILAKDNQGNTMIEKSKVFYLDNSEPEEPDVNSNNPRHCGWTNKNVVIKLDSSDLGSGFVRYQYTKNNFHWIDLPLRSNKLVISTKYENATYKFRAIDGVGLKSSNTKSYCVKIDKFDPIIEFTTDEERIQYKNNHTVQVKVKDIHSKLNTVRYVWSKRSSGLKWVDITKKVTSWSGDFANISGKETMNGTYYLWILARDKAGNEIIRRSGSYKFDNNHPKINSITKNPDSDNGWVNTDVTITVNASDSTSDILEYYYRIDDSIWQSSLSNQFKVEETSIISVKVKDEAGNFSNEHNVNVNIDKNAPEINETEESYDVQVNKFYEHSDMKDFVPIVDQGGSGLDLNSLTYDGINTGYTFSGIGTSKTLLYRIFDNAGNVAEKDVTFNVVDKLAPLTTLSEPSFGEKCLGVEVFGVCIGVNLKSASINVNLSDDDEITTKKYIWNLSEFGAPTKFEWDNFSSNMTSNSETLTKNDFLGIFENWTLWILVSDKSGNSKVYSKSFTI